MKHKQINSITPGSWVWGDWTILDADREAQARGEPYWTLVKAGKSNKNLIKGPFGRKVREPEYIAHGRGHEEWAINISDADARLIAAAPEMLEALKLARALLNGRPSDVPEQIHNAITKATGGTLTDKIHDDIENGKYKKILPHEKAEVDWEYHNPGVPYPGPVKI